MPDFDSHNRVPGASATMGGPEAKAAVPSIDALGRRALFSAIRWGAVLAGVAVGLSVQLALTLLGIATGLSTTSVTRSEVMGIGPLIWAAISMLVSAFVGGYVAARMSGLKRTADGVLHGAVSWAVTTILFAFLATSIGGALVGGVFNNVAQLAQAQEQAAQGQGPLASFMRNQLGQMDPVAVERFRRHIENGERDQAVELLSSAATMEVQRAEAIVDQALILSGAPEAAAQRSTQRADAVLEGAGVAAWVVFAAVALGLVLGISGGRLGVAGARRVNWTAEMR